MAIAIIGILAAIAMPQYRDYVTRGRLADAVTGLSVVRAQMERYYWDNRTYASTGNFVSPCSATNKFGDFVISCVGNLNAQAFTLQAQGSGPVSGFTYTINQQDVRATTALPARWGSTCASKWITKKGDTC